MRVLLYNRDERTHPGGDMIQIRAYENSLRKLGIWAEYDHSWDRDISDFDLVNLTHINFGWTWRHYMVCQKYGKPYVISAIFYPFEQGDMDKGMMKEVINGCRKIMFLSKKEAAECNSFLDITIPPEKVAVVNNGVDDIFTKKGEVWDGAKDYVLTVGRWERGKGQKRVVEACKELGLPVVVLGNLGEPLYKKECEELYPEGFYPDPVPHSEIPKYYRGAKVYVCPSETERHNLCLMEAAACGCNLVSSTENRGNEWYGEGLTIANPYHELGEWVEAIKTEYAKPRTGKIAKLIPTWDKVAEELLKIYTEALQNGKAN